MLTRVEAADEAAAVPGCAGELEMCDPAPVEVAGEEVDHLDVLGVDDHLLAGGQGLVQDLIEYGELG